MNIVHISPTPLVGAPGKIAEALRRQGHAATAIALSDYPKGGPLEGFFIDRYLRWDGPSHAHIERTLAQADVVHVHNDLPSAVASRVCTLNQDAAYIYQVHSPLREGPLYAHRADEIGLPFRRHLVVGQHWGRLYPEYTAVPNLILDPASITLRQRSERLRVMFSPTHAHAGRWTSKHAPGLIEGLQHLQGLQLIDLQMPDKPMRPAALLELRRTCHVTIDEVATGGFHQVSLEGICAGNIVINRADWFARATYAAFCDGKLPPFICATGSSALDEIMALALDVEKTRLLQQQSFDFFTTHCDPQSHVRFFENVYQEACHEASLV